MSVTNVVHFPLAKKWFFVYDDNKTVIRYGYNDTDQTTDTWLSSYETLDTEAEFISRAAILSVNVSDTIS